MDKPKIYDFAIIGSGLGGLQCAYILAKEGFKVLVLEKNHQLGGNLQVFSRDKCVFDTGVHYLGGLDSGQNLNQFFKYFDLMDKLKLRKMDDAFDHINFGGKTYKHKQGYPNFIAELSRSFPEEKEAIVQYCNMIKKMCTIFPLYNLLLGDENTYLKDEDLLRINAHQYIASITKNKILQNVLAGNNPLYAGVKDKTPLFMHALVVNSYIESAYRCVDGGSQIAKFLSKSIHAMGGKILKRKHITGAEVKDKKVINIQTSDGEKYYAHTFISNAHPMATINIFGEGNFRKAYVNRVSKLDNTISTFIVHLVFKPGSFDYMNHNIYHYNIDDVWGGINYTKNTWPECYMISTSANSKNPDKAEGMSIMTYMDISEMSPWAKSHNTIAHPEERGFDYEKFKNHKCELVIKDLEKLFPDIRSKIQSIHSSSPLTFRDYIGNYDGSMYGILKDNGSPWRTFFNPKTNLQNLYITGQNLNLHGILGVTVSALITCFEFLDREKLINKVKDA